LKKATVILFCGLIAACGKGAGPEPKNADNDRAEAPDSAVTKESAEASPSPVESGRALEFRFAFSNATATISMCVDGPFARIDQSWTGVEGTAGRRWGADQSRMIFDSANHVLTVINQTKNTYVKIDAERMAGAQSDLEKGTPIALGNLGATQLKNAPPPAMDGLPPAQIPLPEKSPKKTHPKDCAIFSRELPQGLREETCFAGFEEDVALLEAYAPLLAMAHFTDGLETRIREIETVAAAAAALEWDTGMPVAQFKYGDSPFEEDNAGLESWDRTFTLEARHPCTVAPEDLDPPKDATEEFGLMPWNIPFIVTALPK
jgi:hypothetical protein